MSGRITPWAEWDALKARAETAEAAVLTLRRLAQHATDRQAERDEARKLLDELCEIVADWSDKYERGHTLADLLADAEALLRERHASWPGWSK